METSTHNTPTPEVIEFTTPKTQTRETITTKVTLCGEDFYARRPKDAVLFFAQSALGEVASDADRAMAMLQILDASCDSIRSEEHTSELQSRGHLVCRLLLE